MELRKEQIIKIAVSIALVLTLINSLNNQKKEDQNDHSIFEVKENNNRLETITDPIYISNEEADLKLEDYSMGVTYTENGFERFYPYQDQQWQVIQVTEENYLVTYCELCNIAVIYGSEINGVEYHFETTEYSYGKSSVMKDEETGSYWSQLFGEAILGEHTGQSLSYVNHYNMSWDLWKTNHPNGEVMTLEN